MRKCRILTVANIAPRKRIDLCVRTCAQMEQDFEVDWIVIGNGPLEGEIDMEAPPSMRRLDRMDWQELKRHYGEADVFVLPSYDEGFGMVYIESIMCGCPVICRRGDGGEEIVIRTGGGITVDLPDSDRDSVTNIREAIVRILNNRDQYSSQETVGRARAMVDPDDIKRKWYGLLEKHGVS